MMCLEKVFGTGLPDYISGLSVTYEGLLLIAGTLN